MYMPSITLLTLLATADPLVANAQHPAGAGGRIRGVRNTLELDGLFHHQATKDKVKKGESSDDCGGKKKKDPCTSTTVDPPTESTSAAGPSSTSSLPSRSTCTCVSCLEITTESQLIQAFNENKNGGSFDICGPVEISVTQHVRLFTGDAVKIGCVGLSAADECVLNANGADTWFFINQGNLELEKLTLKNSGKSAVDNSLSSYFEATDVRFETNSAGIGGALYNRGAAVLNDCEFIGNTADDVGGAMYQQSADASIEINGGLFRGNEANRFDDDGILKDGESIRIRLKNIMLINNSSQTG